MVSSMVLNDERILSIRHELAGYLMRELLYLLSAKHYLVWCEGQDDSSYEVLYDEYREQGRVSNTLS